MDSWCNPSSSTLMNAHLYVCLHCKRAPQVPQHLFLRVALLHFQRLCSEFWWTPNKSMLVQQLLVHVAPKLNYTVGNPVKRNSTKRQSERERERNKAHTVSGTTTNTVCERQMTQASISSRGQKMLHNSNIFLLRDSNRIRGSEASLPPPAVTHTPSHPCLNFI